MRNKNNSQQKKLKRIPGDSKTVIVFKTRVPVEQTLFPEKLKLANELLSNAVLLPRK